MAEYKEVRYERLYVKVPGTDKLRRRAEGRLRHLLATGWRETERVQSPDYIKVRVERTSPLPRRVRIKQAPAIAPRPRMGGRDGGGFRGGPRGGGGGFRGGPGGPGGGFRGGPGGPGGPGGGAAPAQAPPASG